MQELRTWNGNAHNTDGRQDYLYEYADRAEQIQSVALQRVLKVKHHDLKTLISHENSSEKYAAGIGLVARESAAYFSNTIVAGVPVEQRIEYGYIYRQTVLNYGTEQ